MLFYTISFSKAKGLFSSAQGFPTAKVKTKTDYKNSEDKKLLKTETCCLIAINCLKINKK